MASLGDLIVRVGANIDGFETNMGTVSQRLTAINRDVARSTAGIDKLGQRAVEAGQLLTAAFTVPLAGVGIAASKMAADFELGMRSVTSLMSSVTQKEFKELSAATLQLSRDLGIDAVRATKALYEAISSGVPKESAVDFLKVASTAAVAGLTDTKIAVDGLTSILNAYRLKTTEAKTVSDAMFQAVNVGKFTFEQLAASISIAIPMAAQLGIGFKEVLAAAATLTGQGFSVAEAMTSIRAAMNGVITPNKEMNQLLAQMGFVSGEALIKAKGLQGTFETLRAATNGNNQAMSEALGRVEALGAVLGLTGRNAEQARVHLDQVTNSAGATAKAFDEIDKATSRQFERLTNEIKATAIQIGNALLPVINDVLRQIKPLMQSAKDAAAAFAALDGSTRLYVLGAATFLAVIGPLTIAFGALLSFIPNAIAGYGSLTLAGAYLSKQFFTLTGNVSNAAFAVSNNLTGALTAGEAAVLTFTAAIAALAGALVLKSQVETLIQDFKDLASSVSSSGKQLLEQGASITTAASNATYANQVFAGMKEIFRELYDWAGKLGRALSQMDIKQAILSALGPLGALHEVLERLKTATGYFPDMSKEVDATAKKMNGLVQSNAAANTEIQKSVERFQQAKAAFVETGNGARTLQQQMEALKQAAESAGIAYKLAIASYYAGNATIDQVVAAWQRMDKAQVAADPTIIFNREKQQKTFGAVESLASVINDLEHQYDSSTTAARKFADLNPVLMAEVALVTKAHQAHIDKLAELNTGLDKSGKATVSLEENLLALALAIDDSQIKLNNSTDKKLPEYAKEIGSVIPEVQRLSDAFRTLGKDQSDSTAKLKEAYQVAADSGVASQRYLLQKQKEILAAEIKDREAAGETITTGQMRRLRKLEEMTTAHQERVKGTWANFVAGLDSILNNLGSVFGRNFFSIFTSQNNKALDQQATQLRESLAQRLDDYGQFVSDTQKKIDEIRQKSFDDLNSQESELQSSLESQRQSYDQFVSSVTQKIEEVREKYAAAVADQTAKQMDGLREQEAGYQEYVTAQIAGLEDFTRAQRERLDEQTRNIQDSLADARDSYQQYAADAIESIDKIRRKNSERAEDQIGNVKQSLSDKELDYKRFVEDTQEKIAKLRQKNKGTITDEEADLQKSLRRRTEDMEIYRSRAVQKIDDIRQEQERDNREQEAEIKKSLDRRTEAYNKYVSDQASKLDDLTAATERAIQNEEDKVNASIEARAQKVFEYRETVRQNIEGIVAANALAQATEERDLQDSLNNRATEWATFQRDTADKMGYIREVAKQKLAEQETDLYNTLQAHRTEWDKYSSDVQNKLKALADAHDTILGRLGDAWINTFKTAGQAIVEFGASFLFDKLFKWLKETLLDDLLEKIGKKLISIFSDIAKLPTSIGGGAGGSVPGLPGPSIPTTTTVPINPPTSAPGGSGGGGAGGGGTGVLGTINMITGVVSAISSVIGNFQMHGIGNDTGKIEENTRGVLQQLRDGLQPQINAYLPELKNIQDFNWNVVSPLLYNVSTVLEKSYFMQAGKLDALTSVIRDETNRILMDFRDTLTPINPETGNREVAILKVYLDAREVGNSVITAAQLAGAPL